MPLWHAVPVHVAVVAGLLFGLRLAAPWRLSRVAARGASLAYAWWLDLWLPHTAATRLVLELGVQCDFMSLFVQDNMDDAVAEVVVTVGSVMSAVLWACLLFGLTHHVLLMAAAALLHCRVLWLASERHLHRAALTAAAAAALHTLFLLFV